MLKKILLGVAVLLALLVVIITTRPSEFTISRSVDVNAPAATVFGYINDLHELQRWNPWAKLDPNLKSTYEGPPSGVGAVYMWEGNSEVGKGKQTIVESVPNEKVAMKLEFFEPFQATNDVVFLLDENAGKTRVTWSMSGGRNFVVKAMSMVMDFDKLIGDDFSKGLAQLKSLAEAG